MIFMLTLCLYMSVLLWILDTLFPLALRMARTVEIGLKGSSEPAGFRKDSHLCFKEDWTEMSVFKT